MNKIVKVKNNKKLHSFNRFGKENGCVIPIIDINESFLTKDRFPHQVYLTIVSPGEIKGPHLHKKRYAMYTCIRGNIKVVVKINDNYEYYYSGEDYDYATIWVEKGIPTAIINLEKEKESFIINTPNPSYQECPDDDYDIYFEPDVLILS